MLFSIQKSEKLATTNDNNNVKKFATKKKGQIEKFQTYCSNLL